MGQPMKIYIDSTVYSLPPGPGGPGTTPADQVQAAATLWQNYFNQRKYGFSIQVVGTAAEANVVVNAADLSGTTPHAGASQPSQSGAITSQNITINTTGTAVASDGTTFPIFDANQNGYQTIIAKIMLHELGHVFGLSDVQNGCTAAQSIMDQLCGVNDSGQGIPLSITSCDDQEEQILEPPPATGDLCAGVSCHCISAGCCTNPQCCPTSDVQVPPSPIDSSTIPPMSRILPLSAAPNERCTPIMLDISGKGFKLTDTDHGVDFDFFGNGQKTRVPWTAKEADNAWLVLDRNGNGTIDDATEMFGNRTPQPTSNNPNGYIALAQYDRPENGGNNDGVIDARDKIFSSLRLWIDKNHNGISEPDELFPLDQLGIEGLDLIYQQSPIEDKNGNLFRLRGSVIKRPGSKINSVNFDVTLVNTIRTQ